MFVVFIIARLNPKIKIFFEFLLIFYDEEKMQGQEDFKRLYAIGFLSAYAAEPYS